MIAALMVLSIVLRTGVFDGVGDYTDIQLLYDRDDLSGHPVPYFDYRLEYPVLIGAFQWLAGLGSAGYEPYFVLSAGGLTALAIATAWLLSNLRGANPWLLAAAPAVAFWGVQNWDFVAIAPLAAALVLHQRGRDAWGAVALAVAVSAKLFPIVVLPVIVVVRLAQRRWRAAGAIMAVFVLVSVAINAPVAIVLDSGGGIALRDTWAYFFEFSRERIPTLTLWTHGFDNVAAVNLASGLLLALGLAAVLVVVFRSARRGYDPTLPAAAASLLWLFATSKLYSVQFALWILLALALAAVPIWVAALFVAVDIVIFATFWSCPACLDGPGTARHVLTALLALFVFWSLIRAGRAGQPESRGALR